jgi:hypothetical protein
MGPLVVYFTLMKWIWEPHVGKFEINVMRMDVHKIIEQMGKFDVENLAKTITPKK